jgi:hypothetical protein
LWAIISGIGFCVLLNAYIYLLRPFTPDGTDAGTQAIENYEATYHAECASSVTILSSRKVNKESSEGSWYESWKIKNACSENHTFLIRFGVSPDAKAFVIEFDLVE